MMENPKPVRGWVEWMKEEGRAGRWGDMNWDEVTSFAKWSPEEVQAIQDAIADFMLAHTTLELETASIKRGLLLSPANGVEAVARDEQLIARNYWKKIGHPELADAITYPRFTYLSSVGSNEIRSRAPLVGEHNSEVYGTEMEFSEEALSSLKERGII
jgi:formyl-CoA transferase